MSGGVIAFAHVESIQICQAQTRTHTQKYQTDDYNGISGQPSSLLLSSLELSDTKVYEP